MVFYVLSWLYEERPGVGAPGFLVCGFRKNGGRYGRGHGYWPGSSRHRTSGTDRHRTHGREEWLARRSNAFLFPCVSH